MLPPRRAPRQPGPFSSPLALVAEVTVRECFTMTRCIQGNTLKSGVRVRNSGGRLDKAPLTQAY